MIAQQYLTYVKDNNGSDLIIKVGNKPMVRINGQLEPIKGSDKIMPEHIKMVEVELLTPDQLQKFRDNNNLDLSYSLPGVGRFRVNAFVQRGSTAFAFRRIEENIPQIDKLGLPEVLKEVIREKRGLILVTGATGNGKSTTVAAMLDYINENYIKNIITLEDPIEFLFRDKSSVVSQREIPNDIDSYKTALKYILRQNPDIIFIGELRDRETIEAALKAAETGHLVISTLHTVNAAQTITRIIDFYEQAQQKQIRYQLSTNLRAVVSQRLLTSRDGKKRVAAVEIMRDTPTIRDLILTPEGTNSILDAIKNGREIYKMQTFDQSISDLYLKGMISYETAVEAATVKKDIELLKGGISYGGAADLYKDMM